MVLDKEIVFFRFLVCLNVWYYVLNLVNRVSKTLQSKDMQVDTALNLINASVSKLKSFREYGFKEAIDETNDPELKEKQQWRKSIFFCTK